MSLLERSSGDVNVPLNEAQTRAILLDIEGTTTPKEFVYQTLFPYARDHLKDFLREHWSSPDVSADIEALRHEHLIDVEQAFSPPRWRDEPVDSAMESAADYACWLMDRDRKSTALKSLQGKIWELGYQRRELRGEVYDDLPSAFSRWCRQKRDICIFSSGSVLAQKLLFSHTAFGDLTIYIRQYFDTNTGRKTDKESYSRIASALGRPPADILFVSDAIPELDAAKLASMATVLCVRPGGVRPSSCAHQIIQTFDQIRPGDDPTC